MNTCPSTETLERFIAADLSEQDADELVAHLESCSACSERVMTLERRTSAPDMDIWQRYHYNRRLWRGPIVHERPDMFCEPERELAVSIIKKIWAAMTGSSHDISNEPNHSSQGAPSNGADESESKA